jgi:hypothetical protein
MRPPTAWLISRNDDQAEKYIQLEFPEVNPDIYTATPLYSHPTAMYLASLEAVECRFDIDKLVGNLVLWEDLSLEEKKFLVHQK